MDDQKTFSEYNSSFDSFELQLNNEAKDFLRGAANWGTGLAIMGFIFSGFMLLAALMMFAAGNMQEMNRAMNGMPISSLAFMYLIMAVMYFIPMLFLIKFASSTKNALSENNTHKLTASFRNLKNHFMSVVISIILIIVVFIVFVAVFAAAVAGSM
ncbi:hypothetical protein HYN59_14475 [Flavobacterium album]|uniref:Uncharacterized protein n=1 Tax=Flavobacterium album TaxID=2175091 RepID=A0A2S1R0Q2_9FLAO|nr:hypothetical protein [Flavobacterium album]AWH86240.1 hypothetical protein HYN59_14475 [Flavobacterium album]